MTAFRRQEIEYLWVDGIQIPPGRRPINFDVVDQLAQSMDRIGLRHPITVRAINEISVHLVAGGHRLQAAKKLGWEKIGCVVLEADKCSEVEAELWEIAENLHRADLSKKQRDAQIRRYAELIALRDANVQSGQNVQIESKRADGRGHRQEGVASKIAKETGVSARTVRRALAEPDQDRGSKAAPSHQQKPAPAQQPADNRDQHQETPSGLWRSEAREEMRAIDNRLINAPTLADRAWLYARLRGRWELPDGVDPATGEIISDVTTEKVAALQARADEHLGRHDDWVIIDPNMNEENVASDDVGNTDVITGEIGNEGIGECDTPNLPDPAPFAPVGDAPTAPELVQACPVASPNLSDTVGSTVPRASDRRPTEPETAHAEEPTAPKGGACMPSNALDLSHPSPDPASKAPVAPVEAPPKGPDTAEAEPPGAILSADDPWASLDIPPQFDRRRRA
jgi:ParB-like chromosome segregation protein Spo0J